MADQTLAAEQEWKQVRRVYRAARFAPRVTIRRNGALAISSDFARMADIGKCTRASLYLSADGLRLGIRFHAEESDDNAFVLGHDGGAGARKDGANRLITAPALLAQSASITALTREDARARQFEPKKDVAGRWVIDLAPCFERVLSQPGEIAVGLTGIYRYRNGNDTVYIGRGNFRDRLSAADRRGWEFDRIEYSILNDDAVERRWEAFWLDEYRRRHNRWPTYNKIAAAALDRTG